MKKLNTLGKTIFGDPEVVGFERYFITLICFSVSVFLVGLTAVHLIMDLVLVPAFIAGITALVLLFLYVMVRFGKCLLYPKLIITVLGLLALDMAWYFKFMSLGPVLFFIFAFGALVIWFWDGLILILMIALYFLNLLGLFFIEYTAPDFGLQYKNLQVRSVDIYFSFLLYSILMIYVLFMIKKDFRRQQEKAKRAERLKTAFLANMSHEIRTPMNAIYGFSKMLETEKDPNQKKHYLKIIQRSSESLLKLINEVVDLSRLEAGYFSLDLKDFSIKVLFGELQRIYKKIMFDKGKTDVKLSFDISSGDIILYSDPSRIKQVLINLIDNAIKFTTRGSIAVSCKRRRKEVVFTVADTGTGIREEDQKNIFSRFSRYDYEGLNKEGTGIGLALVEKIVRMLNGRIWFHSTWGEGTSFHFTLPDTRSDEDPFAREETPGMMIKPKSPHHVIMVVEDDETNYILITKLLQKFNFTIIHARDGEKAVETVRERRDIDLILMDMKLPFLDGFKATKIIKKIRPDLPVIAQTAYALTGDRERALNAGCDEYLSKPLDTAKLIDLILKYLPDVSDQA